MPGTSCALCWQQCWQQLHQLHQLHQLAAAAPAASAASASTVADRMLFAISWVTTSWRQTAWKDAFQQPLSLCHPLAVNSVSSSGAIPGQARCNSWARSLKKSLFKMSSSGARPACSSVEPRTSMSSMKDLCALEHQLEMQLLPLPLTFALCLFIGIAWACDGGVVWDIIVRNVGRSAEPPHGPHFFRAPNRSLCKGRGAEGWGPGGRFSSPTIADIRGE